MRELGRVDFRGSVGFELLCSFLAFLVLLSFSYSSELFLALLCHFAWLYRISCLQLAFVVFHLLDDLLKHFLAFWVF
jgi:hypothetical protein